MPQSVSACPLHRLTASGAHSRLGGAAALLYGLLAYTLFQACILYAIGFIGNWFVPKSIDSGLTGPIVPALFINAGLLLLFVLQHTIMARPAFKAWWTRIIPRAIERSTFVIFACLSLGLLFWQWRPIPQTVWQFTHPAAKVLLTAISCAGWGLLFFSSFIINHFDLFGLRQVWARFNNRLPTPLRFREIGPYRLVRHPLMLGFLIAFWVTPHMTVGHLFFAGMSTLYILMGTWFEERDLIAEHGEEYLAYRARVRGLLPLPRRVQQ